MRHLIGTLVALWLALGAAVTSAQDAAMRDALQERLKQMDRNGDGVLTLEEVGPEVPFAEIDSNADGRLTVEEGLAYLTRLQASLPLSELSALARNLQERFRDEPPKLAPIKQRIAQREFPSVFMAWSPADDRPQEDRLVNIARHDLAFLGPGSVGLRWNRAPTGLADGFESDSIAPARATRSVLQSLNPNFILLAEIRYRDASPSFLPADHRWWQRDQQGNRIRGWDEGGFFLLDFQNPDYQRQVARQAQAAMDSGVFDGIMLDWWQDDPDRLALVTLIREQIGEEAIILVNANDRQTPETAPFINGYFMECYRSATREDWDRIAATLRFAESQLRRPRLNCVETWYAESRRDLARMRATTCLALTHSDGYCLFSDPNELPSPDHQHDWYPFWQRQLGRPTAAGVLLEDGSARREFQHGTAVYNPPDNPPMQVVFDEPRRSAATGLTATEHTVASLDGDLFLSGPLIRQGLVNWKRTEVGAHVIEDFSQPEVNTTRWRIWHSDPHRVDLAVREGRFCIRGRDQIGHNGLWQLKPRRYKDVSLVARFDMRSSKPRTHDLCLHLCGGDMPASPDHWAEVALQDLGNEQVLFHPVVAVEQGAFTQNDRSVTLTRAGDDGFLARVSLDGSSNLCSLEVRAADGPWHAVIEPTPLLLRTTHCEVKMRGEGPTRDVLGAVSEGWFDDVRIYPRPASHPILVRLVDEQRRPIHQRLGETWPPTVHVEGNEPSPLSDLIVELWTADGQHRVARVQSNNFAHYMLPVQHPQWDVFPVAAKIKLFYKDQPLGEVDIPCAGLDGLYPDDAYDLIVR